MNRSEPTPIKNVESIVGLPDCNGSVGLWTQFIRCVDDFYCFGCHTSDVCGNTVLLPFLRIVPNKNVGFSLLDKGNHVVDVASELGVEPSSCNNRLRISEIEFNGIITVPNLSTIGSTDSDHVWIIRNGRTQHEAIHRVKWESERLQNVRSGASSDIVVAQE